MVMMMIMMINCFGRTFDWREALRFYMGQTTAFKKFERVCSASAGHITWNFLKAVFHKFYLVHSGILCPISSRYHCRRFSPSQTDLPRAGLETLRICNKFLFKKKKAKHQKLFEIGISSKFHESLWNMKTSSNCHVIKVLFLFSWKFLWWVRYLQSLVNWTSISWEK